MRAALLEAQRKMADSNFSVLIIIDGFEGAGKSDTINLLLEWLDSRGVQTHALAEPTDEERDRPPQWRFWRRLPQAGHVAIFFGAWEKTLINERAFDRISEAEFDQAIETGVFLVPQSALQRDFNGDAFVYVIGNDGKAVRRVVQTERTSGQNWVVTGGLKAGERVIVQGLNGLK